MRISGITIPEEKRLEIGLTVLFGVGRPLAHKILDEAQVDYGRKPKDISSDEENTIRKIVEEYKLEGNLKREIGGNVKRLIDIKSYRGMRHSRGLPCRGQRTRTNARTLRGKKKTMGSGRKKADKK